MIVLLTGASGGFGKVLGSILTERGLTVYGTARNPKAAEYSYPFKLLPMNVDDNDSIDDSISTIVQREGRIDVVINCINEMFIGSIEEQSVEEVERLYKTNVFGMLRICQQVIPVLRRQGGGTIVNMSSLGGLLAVPYMSAYTSSKFALEAMSESMYHELKKDNIGVVIMQPVAMHMNRPVTGGHLKLVAGVTKESFSHRMLARMEKDTVASGLTPEAVAEKVYQVITNERKPLRVPMDKAKALSLVKRLAPQAVINKLIRGLLGNAP